MQGCAGCPGGLGRGIVRGGSLGLLCGACACGDRTGEGLGSTPALERRLGRAGSVFEEVDCVPAGSEEPEVEELLGEFLEGVDRGTEPGMCELDHQIDGGALELLRHGEGVKAVDHEVVEEKTLLMAEGAEGVVDGVVCDHAPNVAAVWRGARAFGAMTTKWRANVVDARKLARNTCPSALGPPAIKEGR